MAQASVPVSEWTDEAVLGYRVSNWDHALLKMAEYDTTSYDKARRDFRFRGPKSRPETVESAQQDFLRVKRTMLTKLLELRATAGQAQSGQLRTASAVVTMTAGDAGKVVDKMVTTMARAASEVAKLAKKHTELMDQQRKAADQVDRVAEVVVASDNIVNGEHNDAIVSDDEQI